MDDPIREEKTLFEKFKELGKKIFSKPPKHENYFVSPYEIEARERLNKQAEPWSKMGMTAKEFENNIMKFNKILTPNEIRELREKVK